MRLLKWLNGDISLTYHPNHDNLPSYAILSHTWATDDQEVAFRELVNGSGKTKAGYAKIQFCGEQAAKDGFEYFWVDTCCINKEDGVELQMSINSMFKWYRDAAKCYVLLPDVSISDRMAGSEQDLCFESEFRTSRWFTRGWTLQELLAPSSVEFFSTDYKRLGDKFSLGGLIHEITGVPIEALREFVLSQFSIDQRIAWAMKRNTKYEEDLAYCLLGMCNVFLPLIYGEGKRNAFRRLRIETENHERELSIQEQTDKLEVKDRLVLCVTGGLRACQVAFQYGDKWGSCYPGGRLFWKNAKTFDSFEQAYREIAKELAMSECSLASVRDWLTQPENGSWLLILDNMDDLELLFEQNPLSSRLLIREFLPGNVDVSVIATVYGENIAQRLIDREEEIVITNLHSENTESILRSKRPTWKIQNDHQYTAQMEQLLRSLHDANMNTRKNQIVEHHSKTFAWMFDPEGQRPWDNFPEWLSSSSDKVYWVSGKAGSGKSTLMKFLIDAEATKSCLNQGTQGTLDFAIYSFFIWNSGLEIQRSLIGLLCSLAYQIFDHDHNIMGDVLATWPHFSKCHSINDWSIESLEKIILHSLRLHKQPVCIFLDGLDEIDADQGSSDLKGPYYMMQLIENMSSSSGASIKICVSSRPEPAFRLRLRDCPKLQLQELTKNDVEAYAADFLKTKCSFDFDRNTEYEFTMKLVDKSDGVFLWVSLALQTLQRGIASGDRPEELMDRLDKLPRKLGKLYEDMFERLGEDRSIFQATAALYFNLFITIADYTTKIFDSMERGNTIQWDLLNYAIAFDPSLGDMLLASKHPRDMKNSLIAFDRRLTARCAGILEIVSPGDVDELLSRDIRRPWQSIGVGFIHRSAREFLLSERKKWLDIDGTSPLDRKFRILRAIALDAKYPPNEHKLVNNPMMGFMVNTEPSLSPEKERVLLDLTQEIYKRNHWPQFCETTARYGLQHAYDYLVEEASENTSAIASYLLLCSMTTYTMRTNAMVSYLLSKGADPNWLGVISVIMTSGKDELYKYFLTPPLFNDPYSQLKGLFKGTKCADVQILIQSLVDSGANLDQRFLSMELGINGKIDNGLSWDSWARPMRDGCEVNWENYDMITERNYLDLILETLHEHVGDLVATKFVSQFKSMEPHRRILIAFVDNRVYGVNEEDSNAINKILGWPESVSAVRKRLVGDKEYVSEQARKVCEILKDKEVADSVQWLTSKGKGYMILSGATIGVGENPEGNSVHEMAEIYQRLNERFRFHVSKQENSGF